MPVWCGILLVFSAMDDTPRTILIGKLQNNGVASDIAANEVAKAMAMSPSHGAENLKKMGLDYLDTFKLLSLAANEDASDHSSHWGDLFSILFPRSLTRGEYLLRYVFVLTGLVVSLGYPAFQKVRAGTPITSVVPVICFVVFFIYKVAVLDAARFRDRDKTGFYAFFMILPVANLIAQFYLWIAR